MLNKLIAMLMSFGWYTGKSDLLTLKIEGEFEGFYGKASESWEQKFILEIGQINFSKKVFPGLKLEGTRYDTNWNRLAEIAYNELKSFFEEKKE
jgi:hypothetical protein